MRAGDVITRFAQAEDPQILIVVDKLLTGFDAPSCTYLYIDKSMQDHGLFQAICRTNRQAFEVRQILPRSAVIPDEVDVLLVVHPKDLTDSMLYAIDQFALNLDANDDEEQQFLLDHAKLRVRRVEAGPWPAAVKVSAAATEGDAAVGGQAPQAAHQVEGPGGVADGGHA